MLKLKLTKTEHATLPDAIKAEYKASGEDFVLDTDVPLEDVKPIKTALEQERAEKKKLVADKQVLEGQVTDLTVRAGSAGDLEKSYQKKLEDAQTKHVAETKRQVAKIHSLLVDGVANEQAAAISISPSLLAPAIKSRLTVEDVDGDYVTRVLTPDGKASAMSVKELVEEMRANTEYAPILKASEASGGGANGNKAPSGNKPFGDMSEGEKVALFKSNRTKFDQLAADFAKNPTPPKAPPAAK